MDQRQVLELLQSALNQHNAGDLASAETVYRRILADHPANADALHLLGVLLSQRGQPDLGLPLLQQATTILPDVPQFQVHLGQTLAALNRHEEALHALQRAIQLQPGDPDARHAAGTSLFALNRTAPAVEQFRIAAELAPQDGIRMGNYGYAIAHAGRTAESIPILRRATELAPNVSAVWMQLAEATWRCQRYDEALPIARRAAMLAPNDPRAQVLLGNALQTLAEFREAAEVYRRAMQLDPRAFDPTSNLALTLLKMGRAGEALALYDQVCARWPGNSDAIANRSLALLTLGQYERGFAEYEARWRTAGVGRYHFQQPRWDGQSDLAGKTILLMNEQGLGDTLHFVRYAPLLAARGATVIVACAPELRPVIETVAGVAHVLTEKQMRGEPDSLDSDMPHWDFYVPLSSLPGLLRTTLQNIPATVPYVRAAPQRVARFREWLARDDDANLSVGLVWAGTAGHINDRARSTSLAAFAPLAEVAGVTFYSLQKGPPAAQASTPPPGMMLIALGDELHDFADTAALLESLDLLISVDTSVVHLAGALGRPVWTLLAAGPDWRWMLDRDDSPWYPTMRLFRQPEPGAWQPMMQRVADELRKKVK